MTHQGLHHTGTTTGYKESATRKFVSCCEKKSIGAHTPTRLTAAEAGFFAGFLPFPPPLPLPLLLRFSLSLVILARVTAARSISEGRCGQLNTEQLDPKELAREGERERESNEERAQEERKKGKWKVSKS